MAAPRTFPRDEAVDVVVIGTGAGGGNVIRELCRNGVSVVALEAGARFDPERDFENDEWTMFNRLTWTDRIVAEGEDTHAFPVWSCKAVGGSTVHWTGASLRAQPHELLAGSHYGEIENAAVADWPVTFDDLLPWYVKAERFLGVTGRVQELQAPNANYQAIKRGADALGLHIRPNHLALNPAGEFDGRPGCTQRGHCMQGCSNKAMWSTLNEAIPKAEKTGWLELRTECQAIEVLVDAKGLARSVVYARADGTIEEQRANTVVVAANSIQTARLLLNSTSALFPEGLGNGSGLVGRHYMHHVTGSSFALLPFPVHAYKGITVTGLIDDFASSDRNGRSFVGGFNFVTVFCGPAAMSIFAQPGPLIATAGDRGNWGQPLVEMMENFTNLAGIHFIGEDLARPDNEVVLHPTEKDAYGMPVPVLRYTDHPNNKVMRRFAWDRATDIWNAAGAVKIYEAPPFPDTHLLGTCRMGADPRTSVVSPYGQSHEVRNLFIADGSVFPTATAENPTLTICALALRQADYLMEQMAAGAL